MVLGLLLFIKHYTNLVVIWKDLRSIINGTERPDKDLNNKMESKLPIS